MHRREMDDHVGYLKQLEQDTGPVVLINEFNVAREDVDRSWRYGARTGRS